MYPNSSHPSSLSSRSDSCTLEPVEQSKRYRSHTFRRRSHGTPTQNGNTFVLARRLRCRLCRCRPSESNVSRFPRLYIAPKRACLLKQRAAGAAHRPGTSLSVFAYIVLCPCISGTHTLTHPHISSFSNTAVVFSSIEPSARHALRVLPPCARCVHFPYVSRP